ncbi:ComEC/Rec2 family competence protein [Aminivibrio sp.]|jgi:competence protein ComEC|uniref:ComEC/Rec2 family competence protein n=1 Tax=Aminivibrio sp. TaxID=1872489 RepID=UPI001A472C8F|nr:ComEC/Rec2 family competence protein [Aminivibrio sp.]MBL3540360.1 ComEC/Rec2 family competence protein [Aminivibrio sp.]MDK2958929.1 competence protein ComEC [Synergistaceae bacterium]
MIPLPGYDEGIARAPLLFLLGAVFTALVLGDRGMPPSAAGAAASLVCLGLLLLLSGRRPARFLSYCLALALLAFLCSFLSTWRVQNFSPLRGRVLDGGVVILERPWGSSRVVVVDGATGRYLLRLRPDRSVMEGETLTFAGEAVPFRIRENSSFREDLYWRARGVSAEVFPDELLPRRERRFGLPALRTALRRNILLNLPPATRGYLLAAFLGVRDPSLADGHRTWGTAHLLAVSGFHVGLAAAAVWKILSLGILRRRLSFRGRILATSGLLWGYALLAGGAPSALRAALMVQSVLLGYALGRKGSPLNAVSLAGLLLLLWRPEWYADLGWRLSVTAALLLSALAERGTGWRAALAASPLVWLATYPQTAAVFGAVPLSGILVNMAALPVFAFLYPFAAVLSIPALAGIPGGYYIAAAAEGLFLLWQWAADTLTSFIPWSASWSPAFAVAGSAAFIVSLAFGLFRPGLRTFGGALLALLAGMIFF